jgi:predicted DNA-binding transcriptional regulator YafY
MSENKSRILYVLRFLQEKSDEKHPVSTKQILDYLETQGFKTHRRTVYDDIKLLIDFGVDVVPVKSTQNLYFVGDRQFETPELKLLIDAVLSSKVITPKKSSVLANKLRGLMSEHQMAEFAEEFHIADRIKPKNESVYLTTDTIQNAINEKKQIRFKYFEYLADKSKVLKHNGYEYSLSPYDFFWNEDKYYVFGYSPKHGKVVKFRVDRMDKVKKSHEEAVPCPEDFDIAVFCKQVFGMYDGDKATIELKCRNDLMKVIIDQFGDNVHTEIIDAEWFKVKTGVSISPTFFGWLFQFTERMVLLSPDEVIREYGETLIKAKEIITGGT